MARRDDGHADLDDVYDALGRLHTPNDNKQLEINRQIAKTNLLLAALLRHFGARVPIGEFMLICDKCHEPNRYRRLIVHEGDFWPITTCPTCGSPDVKIAERE